ncbi:MAG: hypothetical protein ACP5QY_04090, partial [Candidatus Hydrogenedens sp.]
MRRFYYLNYSIVFIFVIFAVVNGYAQTARILVVGDDWAEKILEYNVWGDVLNYYGFNDVSVIGDTTAVSGTTAEDWASDVPNFKDSNMPLRTYSLQNALLNNPTADIVYLSLGLNDILKNWKKGMLPQPGGNNDIFDTIQQNIQTVVDYILSIRPDVKIALADYDYINIYELALEGVELAQELYIQMDYPTPAELNQAFYELGLRKILISATRYRTEYVHSFGLQQYWYGHNGYYLKSNSNSEGEIFTDTFFPPFPMNTTPYPGHPPSYTPLPGGNIDYPSPMSAMGNNGTDPIHLNEEGYRIIFENSLFQHIFDWLIDTTPPFVVSIKRDISAQNPTRNPTLQFIVTFSEPVSVVTPADFIIDAPGFSGTSIISVTGSGTTRTVTVNRGTGNGNFSIDFLDRDTIVDDNWRILGNNLGVIFGSGNGNFTTGEVYTVDTSRPFIQITPTTPSPTTNDYTIFSVEFSEPVKGFTADDIMLMTSGNGSAQITNFSGSGANYQFHINVNRSSDFYVNVVINAGVCTDLVGNTNYTEIYSNYLFQEPTFTIDELYRSNGKLGNLILNSGDILTIYTGDQIYQPFYRVNGRLAISGRSVDMGSGNYVSKFDFETIYVPSGVTVNVSGINPLVISATKDITWNTTLDVSGTVPGRAGGGVGGNGGSGGAGGTGGAGGSMGGYGGAQATGGAGGNNSNGGNGQNGTSNPGTPGGIGLAGNSGEVGMNGSNGQLGFGQQGIAGSGGTGGTPGGISPTNANGGSVGTGGSIGIGSTAQNCVNVTAGSSGGNGSNGGNGTIGAIGVSGGNGSNGNHAEFTAPANNLYLAG